MRFIFFVEKSIPEKNLIFKSNTFIPDKESKGKLKSKSLFVLINIFGGTFIFNNSIDFLSIACDSEISILENLLKNGIFFQNFPFSYQKNIFSLFLSSSIKLFVSYHSKKRSLFHFQ